jgi:D-alanine--poly(phosphoribitol) ligase subunit 1
LIILISKLQVFSPNNFHNLRFIVFGGEAFPKDILKKVVTDFRGNSQAVSVYGPTEGTCICSVNFIKDSDLESEHKYVSLGNFPEFFNYTLKNFIESDDSNSQNLATLFISGPNVTNKYVTPVGQDRFIQDTSGYTQYNTGDLVYLDEETQELYFAGREDNQIKRNGIRIELEEIESIIEGLPGVSGCIAVFDSNKKDDLVAYIEGMVELEPLTRKIREVLPIYMHPKKIHIIEKLPRNSNGKKDRLVAKRIDMG